MTGSRDKPRRLAAIFLDCGDTLIDERTEVKLGDSEIVVSAALIPGADTVVETLKRMGHVLVLVADGPVATFENVLKPRGLWQHFSHHVISERVGVHKPDPAMFRAALSAIGLGEERAGDVVMVGNNLSRDIRGANRMGMTSVFLKWSTLRSHIPVCDDEIPDHTIEQITDLPALIAKLDAGLAISANTKGASPVKSL